MAGATSLRGKARGKSSRVSSNDTLGAKFPNDLPPELLVSVFLAVKNLRWVRHNIPLVCKKWVYLYRSEDASPLHEELFIDFQKEEAAARQAVARRRRPGPVVRDESQESDLHGSVFYGSRAIKWVQRRAGSVHKLRIQGEASGSFEEGFSSEDVGRLVAAAGSSLTDLWIDCFVETENDEHLWKSLRKAVVPAGQLRSLVVKYTFADVIESDLKPLGQLAGSLEELVLNTSYSDDPESSEGAEVGLRRFPESLCALPELRCLELVGHSGITEISAKISSLKKLEELTFGNLLSSLPKDLIELSGLTKVNFSGNRYLGDDDGDDVDDDAPQDEAFHAELGQMKSLRDLRLSRCGLRTVPAFIGELESLEILDLSSNDLLIDAPLDFLIEGCPSLSYVYLVGPSTRNRGRTA